MFDIYMRSFKDALMVPFLACLRNYKFSPNYLTVLSLIYGLIGLCYISQHRRYIGFAFCFTRQILDGLDGAYARATN